MNALVLAVGNPMRRDDGVAHAVLEQVRPLADGIATLEVYGDPASVVSAWSGHDLVVLVDAVTGHGEPGDVVRFERGVDGWDVISPDVPLSSHGWSLADAVELGAVLGQVPARLVLVGVVADDLGAGEGLTPAVTDAVGPATALVLSELGRG